MSDYLDTHTVCGTHCEPGECPGPTIPANIYYSQEHDNFYHAETQKGQGWKFYGIWAKWCHKFPQGGFKITPPEFRPATDDPETPEQALECLRAWADSGTYTFSNARAKKIHDLLFPAYQLPSGVPFDRERLANKAVDMFRMIDEEQMMRTVKALRELRMTTGA